ncbi:MAG: DUF3592 domain-containing protein [Planctomycetes bacterium]|nr:DUF3592 domain-containing protein [Planctomycetota bacterium]
MAEQSEGRGGNVSTVIFGILFVLAGVAGIGYGVKTVLDASNRESWPTAKAVITSSKVRVQRPRSGGGSSTTIAEITYRYSVEGRTYTSDRVTSAQYGSSNSSRAYGQVRKYPVGKEVTAHYNPDDPSYAILDTQWERIYGLAFAAGAVGLLIGLLMLKNAVRSR